jgi:hypothetical protein
METAQMQKTEISPYDELTRTASFVLVFRQMLWLEEEAQRRRISKSELVRNILDEAMKAQEASVA